MRKLNGDVSAAPTPTRYRKALEWGVKVPKDTPKGQADPSLALLPTMLPSTLGQPLDRAL